MAQYVFVVFTEPVPSRDDEFNQWYDDLHLGDVLKVPGFVAAQRFRLAGSTPGAPARYLALYEIETDDVDKTLAELYALSGTPAMVLSEALDMSRVKAWTYQAIGPRRTGCRGFWQRLSGKVNTWGLSVGDTESPSHHHGHTEPSAWKRIRISS